jgi:hypothetical protein
VVLHQKAERRAEIRVSGCYRREQVPVFAFVVSRQGGAETMAEHQQVAAGPLVLGAAAECCPGDLQRFAQP